MWADLRAYAFLFLGFAQRFEARQEENESSCFLNPYLSYLFISLVTFLCF